MSRKLYIYSLLVAAIFLVYSPTGVFGDEHNHDHDHDHDDDYYHNHAHDQSEEDDYDLSVVTCGSVVKLLHVQTNHRLHSHKVTYGSGSGQQSVTGYPGAEDTNSLWIVRGPHGKKPCKQGDVIKDGDVIRLQHKNTGKNLHSHLHASPLSHQQEVSAFDVDEAGNGDEGDDWIVETSGTKEWKRGENVAFKHKLTGKYLRTHDKKYGHPISGQQEVTAHVKDDKAWWKTMEGVYFPANR